MQSEDPKHADDGAPLPDGLALCHALILEQAKALVAVQESQETLRQENEELNAYVRRLLAQLYGRRSERVTFDPKQRTLDFGDAPEADALCEAAAEAEKLLAEHAARRQAERETRPERRPRRQEKFPPHLPRVEKIIEPPAEERECPAHGPKRPIGYDLVEKLHFERPRIWIEVLKYAKYACVDQPECGVTQAERPTGLVEGDRYAPSVAAEVTANKYAYHLPLYREQDLFAGSGWTPSRSTLVNLLAASDFVLRPLYDCLRRLTLASGALGCDDTRVTLIVPPVPPPVDPSSPRSQRTCEVLQKAIDEGRPSVNARMWAYRPFDLPINLFDFTVSRSRDGPEEMLRDYAGLLMGDCYSGFEGIVLRSDARIVRAACWTHARRKLIEVQTLAPLPASALLAMIGLLYDIETRAKDRTVEERLTLRQREAKPVLARIRQCLDTPPVRDALPKSALAKATGYLRNQWDLLERYTTDGRFPIDNNDTEQLMKQVALGRKNWLFVGSVAAGERAARLMTLVSSAIRNHLDVAIYLKDVLERLLAGATDYDSLCPHVWKLGHPEAVRQYRIEERRDAADRQRIRRARRRIRKP